MTKRHEELNNDRIREVNPDIVAMDEALKQIAADEIERKSVWDTDAVALKKFTEPDKQKPGDKEELTGERRGIDNTKYMMDKSRISNKNPSGELRLDDLKKNSTTHKPFLKKIWNGAKNLIFEKRSEE